MCGVYRACFRRSALFLVALGAMLATDWAVLAQEGEPTIDGKALSVWIEMLKDADASKRRSAAQKLALRATADCGKAVPALVDCLKDMDKQTASNANNALGRIGPSAKDAVPHLFEALAAKRVLSVSVFTTLKRIGPDARPELNRALSHKSEEVRKVASRVLADLGPDEKASVAELMKALKDKDYGIRRNVLATLAKLGPDAKPAVPDIVKLLGSDLDADDASRTLAAIGTPAIVLLQAALKDKNDRLRQNAATALGLFPKDAKKVVPALLDTLRKDMSAEVQGAAARSLGKYEDVSVLVLTAYRTIALKEVEVPLRFGFIEGIANFKEKGRPAMDILVLEAQRSRRDLSYLHARCLWAIGEVGMDVKVNAKGNVEVKLPSGAVGPGFEKAHRQALLLLAEGAKSTNDDCRKAAIEALRKIDPKGEIARALTSK